MLDIILYKHDGTRLSLFKSRSFLDLPDLASFIRSEGLDDWHLVEIVEQGGGVHRYTAEALNDLFKRRALPGDDSQV